MKARAQRYLSWRYDDQAQKFPRMLEIPKRLYIARNLAATLQNMRNFPRGSMVYVSEAWRFDA